MSDFTSARPPNSGENSGGGRSRRVVTTWWWWTVAEERNSFRACPTVGGRANQRASTAAGVLGTADQLPPDRLRTLPNSELIVPWIAWVFRLKAGPRRSAVE